MKLGGKPAAAVFVVALAAGGCGAVKQVDATTQPTSTTSASSTSSTGAHPRPVLELASAGAEPRSLLHVSPHEGAVLRMDMTMELDVSIAINGKKAPEVDVPPMVMGMVVSIDDVSDTGEVTSSFSYDHVDVEGHGPSIDGLRSKLQPMTGIKGTLRTSASGELLDVDIDLPDDLDPAMRQTLTSMEDQLANMMVPLPQEPVGAGASWTVHTEAAINGIAANMDYTYRLVERDGDRIVLESSYVQTAPQQEIHPAGVPEGVVMRVESMRVVGTGRTVMELGNPLPIESRVEARGPIRMTVKQGAKHMSMEQVLHMIMRLEPRS